MDINSFALGYSAGKKKGGSGGGVELNIAYGDTPPEDTSKLWVKCENPSKVIVSNDVVKGDAVAEGSARIEAVPSATFGYSYGTSQGRVSVGKKAYLFGGWGNGYENKIRIFDPETEKITDLTATLPTAIAYCQPVVFGKDIYIFGGSKGTSNRLNSIVCFDTETETAETLGKTLPEATESIGAAAVGNRIYLFGGSSSRNKTEIYRFDPDGEGLDLIGYMPKGGSTFAWPHIGTKIYLRGQSNVYRFDADTEKLVDLELTLPRTGRDFIGLMGTKNYQFGESGESSIYYFDTETEEFGELPISTPVTGLGVPVYMGTGKIYYSVGQDTYVLENLAILLDEGTMQIMPSASDNVFPIVNTDAARVEIGVKKVYKGNSDGVGDTVDAALYKDQEWVTIEE